MASGRALNDSQLFQALQTAESDSELFSSDELSDSDYEDSRQPSSDSDSNRSADEEVITSEPECEPRPKRARAVGPRNAALDFKWTRQQFLPQVFEFNSVNSGIPEGLFPDDAKEINFFQALVTEEMMEIVVRETNKFHAFLTSRPNIQIPQNSRLNIWSDTNVKELYVFIAISMLMVRNKKISLEEYWSTDWLLHMPQFSKIMSRNRYLLLLRVLHFSDNETQQPGDRLHKLKDIVNTLKKNFSTCFVPFRNVCIDESLVLFKGRLSFKQYIPSKRHRFGIKLFVLCDCETGYILDFIVYVGAQTEVRDTHNLGYGGAVVTTLLEPYLNKGHCLFVDNWYTSPSLFLTLHENRTNACGTCKRNRKGMPVFQKKLKRMERESYSSDKIEMMALVWKDKREVCMLTTKHADEEKETGKRDRATGEAIKKPVCIVDYNGNMGAVDRSDMMVTSIECLRKTIKWYRKLWFHMIDMCLLNAHALFMKQTNRKTSLPDFQMEVIRQLLEKYHLPRPKHSGGRRSQDENPLRLTERHFPSVIPATEKKTNPTRICHVCKHTKRRDRKRKESRYFCKHCDFGLCVTPCFEEFHTIKNF